jgi:hypothetical protein
MNDIIGMKKKRFGMNKVSKNTRIDVDIVMVFSSSLSNIFDKPINHNKL